MGWENLGFLKLKKFQSSKLNLFRFWRIFFTMDIIWLFASLPDSIIFINASKSSDNPWLCLLESMRRICVFLIMAPNALFRLIKDLIWSDVKCIAETSYSPALAVTVLGLCKIMDVSPKISLFWQHLVLRPFFFESLFSTIFGWPGRLWMTIYSFSTWTG